ncbi:MarR family transcriptional regulator [Ignavibacterium sp.]|uniref:MarR family winged helix-turn-helix transcriptional regulator n=1 Tax=Ignavibacterium sp. TaxID=2651167 RepID=UPI002202ED65|nr:MarR family transcriptional regulator [Ignavibacterium sp.]BDQ03122.1 MAG: transcriptional regulator [Ignavibacterium sp.]
MGEALKQRLKTKKFDSDDLEVILNIFVTANYLRSKHDAVLSKYALTSPQYNVLRILKGAYPEGYPRCEIISRMIEPAPDVTRLVDRLVKENLVERFYSENDKRLSLTRITEKGIKLLDKIRPDIDDLNKLISSHLSKEEKRRLSELLEKIYSDSLKE